MSELSGRTVVITGAGSGIGRSFAEGFLAEGASVVLHGPHLHSGPHLIEQIQHHYHDPADTLRRYFGVE